MSERICTGYKRRWISRYRGFKWSIIFTGYDYEGFEIYEEFDAYFWLKTFPGTGVFTYEALPGDYFLDEGYPIATDVDLDGDPDILVYNQTDDNVYCYYNVDGLGEFFHEVQY